MNGNDDPSAAYGSVVISVEDGVTLDVLECGVIFRL